MNAPTGGWFAVSRADLATLMDGAGEGGAGTMLAVWLSLLSVANIERTTAVVIHIGRVARLSGISYRAAATALRRLASVGLVAIHARKLAGTAGNDASLYELHATVSPCADFAEGTADFAEGSVNHDVGTLPTKINTISKEINKRTRERASSDAAGITPELFPAKAEAANGGRLTGPQLASFCDYWLERDPKGRCRFESQRFFELSRRIATWASRERAAPAGAAAAKPERPVWVDCARRCRHWDTAKRWCSKFVKQEPKSCDHCREF